MHTEEEMSFIAQLAAYGYILNEQAVHVARARGSPVRYIFTAHTVDCFVYSLEELARFVTFLEQEKSCQKPFPPLPTSLQ